MTYVQSDFIDDVIKRISSIKRRNVKERYSFLEALQHDQPNSQLTLVLFSDDRAWGVRAKSIEMLGNYGGALARITVKAALNDTEWLVRATAVEVLGKIGKVSDAHWLKSSLEDRSWQVRSAAASSLVALSGSNAKSLLQTKYRDERHEIVRRDLVYALLDTNDSASFFQENIMTEESHIVRIALIWALYRLGDYDKIADLISLLKEQNDLIRRNAVHAIEPSLVLSEHKSAITNALKLMINQENNPGIREDAMIVLQAIAAS